MNRLRKAAMAVYSVMVCLLLLGGILYLSRSEFMFYHAQAVGTAWQAVPVNTRALLLALDPYGRHVRPECRLRAGGHPRGAVSAR